jgi:hypothetical protein
MRASAKRASRSHRSTKPSEPLFHGIANEDQGADRRFPRFFENMTQNFFDLGLAGADPDLAHKRGQALSARHEARCLTFGKSPVINKLNIEAAMCGRRREHASLHALRNVPGGLSAYRGIEGKNEPAPTSLGRHGQFRRSFEKTLDIRLGAGLWHDDRAFVPWLTHLAPRALSFPDIYKSCFLGAAQCLGGNFPSAASPIGPRGRDARTI